MRFSGSSLKARFDLSANIQNEPPTIAWRIDDGKWQESEIASVVSLADGLSSGSHTVCLMVRGLDEHHSRWMPPLVSSVSFLGFELPKGGSVMPPLEEWINPKLKIEFLGDSITEGILVQVFLPDKRWTWQTDALNSYSAQTAMRLGAAWRQVGFGATGLAQAGFGGAPPALESLDFFYHGCPRDDWQPDLVVINQGTNESTMSAESYQPLYSSYLSKVREAYPKAKIVALEPFSGAQGPAIEQAVYEARKAGDKQIYFIDTTGWYSGDVHPNLTASPELSKKLSAALKAKVL